MMAMVVLHSLTHSHLLLLSSPFDVFFLFLCIPFTRRLSFFSPLFVLSAHIPPPQVV